MLISIIYPNLKKKWTYEGFKKLQINGYELGRMCQDINHYFFTGAFLEDFRRFT
jgi:hypothetical protein